MPLKCVLESMIVCMENSIVGNTDSDALAPSSGAAGQMRSCCSDGQVPDFIFNGSSSYRRFQIRSDWAAALSVCWQSCSHFVESIALLSSYAHL